MKDPEFINIETSESDAGKTIKKAEESKNTIESLKEHNPELTPNSRIHFDEDNINKDYLTARNQPTKRIEMVNSKRKKAKDSMSSKVGKSFGLKKKSVQISDPESLTKSAKPIKKDKNVRHKVNHSLIDYNEKDSIK